MNQQDTLMKEIFANKGSSITDIDPHGVIMTARSCNSHTALPPPKRGDDIVHGGARATMDLVATRAPSLVDMICSGELIGKIKSGDLLLSDGLKRTSTVTSILKANHCQWNAQTKTWSCKGTKEHTSAIISAARRNKAVANDSNSDGSKRSPATVSPLQRSVEAAMGARIDAWPAHFTLGARAANIGYRAEKYDSGVGRWALTLFCLHNGCSPMLYVEWLRDRGCIKADAWGELKSTMIKMASGSDCGLTWDLKKCSKVPARMADSDSADLETAKEELAMLMVVSGQGGASVTCAPPAFKAYYASNFPYTDIARLLHRQDSPFQLRTIAYRQPDGRCALQSRPVLDLNMLRHCMNKYGGMSLHAGPAFTAETQAPRLEGALGTELVLEIDEVPSGVDEAQRWKWLRHAVEVTVAVLREWFGFTDLFCFASGNRGPHVWVRDTAVFQQTLVERTHLFDRLRRPTEEPGWLELSNRLLIPFYARWHSDEGLKPTAERLVKFAFPSFDAEVALQPKHLHRLPFSIHEKTGRIAVPFASNPPFAGMPVRQEGMPHADNPDLESILMEPLKVLHEVIGTASAGDVNTAFVEKQEADWRVQSTQKARKRKEQSGEADVPVAPMRVNCTATAAWASALRIAATATKTSAIDDADARSIAERTVDKGKDWRVRLESETKAVEKLLSAVGDAGLLHGETYTIGDGRTLTRYPQLDQGQFVQRLAKETRHRVTNHEYAEVDLSTAHVAASWGACEQHYGTDKAANLCSHLRMAASDKKGARALVKLQTGWSDARCKSAILATLNQEPNDGIPRCAFLNGLVNEREHMVEALRAHSVIAGSPFESIRRKCLGHSKPMVREFSLMLQTLEGAIVRKAVQTLREHGFETAAFIADGLLVRPTTLQLAK